jgi:hypothetical protein
MNDTNNADMVVQLLHDYIYNAAVAVHGCPTARTSTTQHRMSQQAQGSICICKASS